MKEKLIEILGLPAETTEDEIMARLISFQAAVKVMEDLGEILGLEEAGAGGIKEAVAALKQAEEEARRLQEEVDRLQAAKPADETQEREEAQPAAETDPAGLEAPAAADSGVLPLISRMAQSAGDGGFCANALSPGESAVIRLMGITAEQFQLAKESL